MEVLRKEKAVSKKKNDVSVLNMEDVMEVQKSVKKMLQTSTSLKGKYVRIFLSNLETIEPLLSPLMKAQNKLVEDHVVFGEDNQPKQNGETFEFKSDDDAQKFQAETKEIWAAPAKDVKFFKMSISDFDNMDINTSQNDSMFLILKYLVDATK